MRALAVLLVMAAAGMASADDNAATSERVIVLGVDGLDPELLQGFMDEGLLPNFSTLAKMGGFTPLATSIPPQSPVAWSNFITGMGPGGHGIFDFIGFDRRSLTPYMSTTRLEQPTVGPLAIGDLRIPIAGGEVVRLRDGVAFWEILESNGVPTTVFQIPANYPPVDAGGSSVSGMGTPDLQGTPGTFTYYTSDDRFQAGPVSGGLIRRVEVVQGIVRTDLVGPPNVVVANASNARAPFEVHVDAVNPVGLIRIGEQEILLNEGEWSEWLSAEFELLPHLVSVSGIVRFYLKQTAPEFALYASPVNIDPRDPAQVISSPPGYAGNLAAAIGQPYYTQEMPEDTKALSAGVLDPSEFLTQTGLVLEERRALLRHELEAFRNQRPGLLFFYVGTVDQRHHMLARHSDPDHPFHEPQTPAALASALRDTYEQMDELVGWLLDEVDEQTTLIVMSDHGFAPFRRQVNLNTWLEQEGYLKVRTAERQAYEWLSGIDWSATRAFAIGLNSLYLNVRGRERYGIVDPAKRTALAREIAERLHGWRDSKNGNAVVTHAALREDVYDGEHVDDAPDIIVGYARNYRASWATTSGEIPFGLIVDNTEEWSGDHCMDARAVPGVLLSSRRLTAISPDLRDLTVSILSIFGVREHPQMQGDSVF
jgi:predicted AlkP superfamily phosphohydrolase/phosphomutase